MPDDTVEIDRETANVLLEVADTLVDDIASGRTWGHTKEDAEENAAALDHAQSELRRAINDA